MQNVQKFLQTNFLVLILLNSENVFNYLFQLIVARSLPSADYGSFNALTAISVMVLAPLGVVPLIIARYTVRLSSNQLGQVKMLLWFFFKWLLLVGLGILIIGLLAIPWLKSYLHINSSTPILIILFSTILALFLPLFSSILQGLQRIAALALCLSGSSVIRVILVLILVAWLGWRLNGALIAVLLVTGITLSFYLFSLRDVLSSNLAPLPNGLFKEMAWYALPVSIFTLFVSLLGNFDLVLVRHYHPEESGLYATATILAKIALFVPSALVIVLFPEAAKNQEAGEENPHILWTTLGLVALLSGGVALFCNLFPVWIINLLFGSQYIESAALLQVISIAMALLALCNVIFTYSLAHFRYGFIWFLSGGVVLFYLLIYFYHDTSLMIANMLLLCTAVIFICTLVWFWYDETI